ncbi:Inositol-tetrakisphosphate 1-kinase [Armadillidium nasatum]|uniref:Inositol-tetrakisphosphate 1-kinase n=1 Tax=Armadillidium nasatum TaxID=96803 RepID=A0A5N5TCJ7_9CRUS|nr:Inositol-tetrakisphosphate 1-kinase [Armadillidium nasatum]
MLNSTNSDSSFKVVGYWFNEKKSQKFGANDLAEACRKRHMNFVKAQELVKKIEKFVVDNPQMKVVDPLPCIRRLLLRVDTYLLLEEVTRDEVCKNFLAGGGRDAHEMSLVFNVKSLGKCLLPCVAQSFINHNAVLYKVFVIGDRWFVTLRPSLKNFNAGDSESIIFNSHQISKPDSSSPLTHCEELDAGNKPKADLLVLDRIVYLIRSVLRSDLLGIDVVIEKDTGRYGIIDVNPFPSFDSVPNVMDHLADAIRNRIDFNDIQRTSDSTSSVTSFNFHSTFHVSIHMDQSYFLQDISRPELITCDSLTKSESQMAETEL